jgi:MFS family permease
MAAEPVTLGAQSHSSRRDSASIYPWVLLGLLWVVSMLNAADRSVLIAVMPQLRDAFHLDRTQLALLNSLFLGVYAVAALASGILGDHFRRSRVVILGLIFWSTATGICALAMSFPMLLMLRAVVGVGESTYYPAGTALIGDWHQPRYISRALSLHQTAVFAGGGIGALVAGMLADQLGWRAPFFVFGGLGVIYGLILLKVLKDRPVDPSRIKPQGSLAPMSLLLKTRSAMMLCGVFALGTGASTGIQVWAPTYVHDVLQLNMAGSALYGSTSINVAGFLSVPLGGLLADMLGKRFTTGRFAALAIGLVLAGVGLLPLVLAHDAMVIGLVLMASSFGKGIFDGCIYAAMQDVIPPSARSTAVGFMTMTGFIGAGIAPVMIARLAGAFSMPTAITSMALLYFAAASILGLSLRRAASDVHASLAEAV